MSPGAASDLPLVAHIVFRFDYGGLENGIVNVINGLAGQPFRHVVIAMSETTGFAERLRDGVSVYAIGKQPGKDPAAYLRLYRLLRQLRPAVVHTRNFGTLDCSFIAFLARVPVRIHGEHGWDVYDPDGKIPRYQRLRRLLNPFVNRFVAVSEHLRRWLVDVVGISGQKVDHICNGVDVERFRPRSDDDVSVLPEAFASDRQVVVGTVTRFSAIKDPLNLVEAFIALCSRQETVRRDVRLVMIGDGDLLEAARQRLAEAGLAAVSWLPGSRDDVPELLRSMDVFVLGSLREGISNTILEAMATGIPVIASDTGGNVELVRQGSTGVLVAPGDRAALAAAISDYVHDPERRLHHGRASRDRVVSRFSIERMVEDYGALYANALGMQGT
jgi:sugar transferase (PEP-CTERM/EpsH1 system associated)